MIQKFIKIITFDLFSRDTSKSRSPSRHKHKKHKKKHKKKEKKRRSESPTERKHSPSKLDADIDIPLPSDEISDFGATLGAKQDSSHELETSESSRSAKLLTLDLPLPENVDSQQKEPAGE